MNILLITDIHHGQNTRYPKHKGEGYISSFGEMFETYIPKLQEEIKKHDLVMFLGDLIQEESHEKDVENYRKTMDLLEVGIPVHYVIGNHDLKFLSKKELSHFIGQDKIYYSFDMGGYHHIVLDTNKLNLENGEIDLPTVEEEQFEWLKRDLSNTLLPTLVYSHYPVDAQDLQNNYYFKSNPERAFAQNREEIRALFESSGKVLGVFSGHLHFKSEMDLSGITHITVPAFSENDGSHKPQAECVALSLQERRLSINILKIES